MKALWVHESLVYKPWFACNRMVWTKTNQIRTCQKRLTSLMRCTPKKINCMHDHTLMQHNNNNEHNKKFIIITAREKHIIKHKTATPCCLSSLVFETFLLVLPSDAFKVTAGLHLASHLFPAIPWGDLSSALLGPVLYCPHSNSLGKCPSRHNSFSVILQVSDAFLQLFPFYYLTTSQAPTSLEKLNPLCIRFSTNTVNTPINQYCY